mgnify:CR=1 FL=1
MADGEECGNLRRILRDVLRSIAAECDSELVEARALFGDKINQHLVSPVLQKVYKDLFPYVCAVAAVLVIILVFVLMVMFVVLSRGLVPH